MPYHEIARFDTSDDRHAAGVAAVCQSLGWPSYSEPAVAARGCAAPGATTMVALDERETVVGFAQVFGDGIVHGWLAQVGVLATHRRRGIAGALVEAALVASGVQRLDLVTDDADRFYESLPHRSKRGYRVYSRSSATSDEDA